MSVELSKILDRHIPKNVGIALPKLKKIKKDESFPKLKLPKLKKV